MNLKTILKASVLTLATVTLGGTLVAPAVAGLNPAVVYAEEQHTVVVQNVVYAGNGQFATMDFGRYSVNKNENFVPPRADSKYYTYSGYSITEDWSNVEQYNARKMGEPVVTPQDFNGKERVITLYYSYKEPKRLKGPSTDEEYLNVYRAVKRLNGRIEEFLESSRVVLKNQNYTAPIQEFSGYSYAGFSSSRIAYLGQTERDELYNDRTIGQPITTSAYSTSDGRSITLFYNEVDSNLALSPTNADFLSIQYIGKNSNNEFVDLGFDTYFVAVGQDKLVSLPTLSGYSYSGYHNPSFLLDVEEEEKNYNNKTSGEPIAKASQAFYAPASGQVGWNNKDRVLVVYYDQITTPDPTPQPQPQPKVEVKTETAVENLPFGSSEVKNPNLPKGTRRVKVAGVKGQVTITYEVTYTNGVKTSRVEKSRKVTKAAVNEVIEVGTKEPTPTPKPTPKPTPSPKPQDGLKPVYRLYHSGLQVHLYTVDSNEYQVLGGRGWNQEGVAWQTASTGDPVYRLYHTGLRVHLYTKDANEYKVLASRGWKQEGVAYYSKGAVKVYRLYHPGIKKHLYTKDANEYKVLASRGWQQEGLAWYAN